MVSELDSTHNSDTMPSGWITTIVMGLLKVNVLTERPPLPPLPKGGTTSLRDGASLSEKDGYVPCDYTRSEHTRLPRAASFRKRSLVSAS